MRGPGGSVEGQAQFGANAGKNGIEVVADLSVGEAQHADTEVLNHRRPPGVVVGEPFVLPAVQFDDELRRMTVEVCDIPVEASLPPIPGSEPIGANISGPCIGRCVFFAEARADGGAGRPSGLAGRRRLARA